MSLATLVTTQAPVAGPGEPSWKKAAQSDGVAVYTRVKKGTNLQELTAVGMIDAPPLQVWKAVRDYDNYKTKMPYTEESRVLSKAPDGKSLTFYSVINAPLVSRRDYVIRVRDESAWQDGKGFLKATWTSIQDGPPPKPDVVRVAINDGSWLLEPKQDGKKTLATYYVFTDPGGSLPRWVANSANGTAVPNVFKCVRKASAP